MGPESSTFFSDLSGLTGGTIYHYKVLGSNSFSIAWSPTETLLTTVSAGPVNWYVALDGTGDGTNWATAFPAIRRRAGPEPPYRAIRSA